MATEIQELQLPNGKRVFVEVEIVDDINLPNLRKELHDLPPGAEPTGIVDDALNGMRLFQENISFMGCCFVAR